MSKLKNPAAEATIFASRAERQIASLNKALSSMRDSVTGLQRAIRVPVPKGGSRYTKRTRTGPSPFVAGGLAAAGSLFAGGILDTSGLGGYPSSAQVASSWVSAFQRAQRIM